MYNLVGGGGESQTEYQMWRGRSRYSSEHQTVPTCKQTETLRILFITVEAPIVPDLSMALLLQPSSSFLAESNLYLGSWHCYAL